MSSKDHVSELTAHLGYWLRFVSNHVSHGFARKVARKDVTIAEWAVMRCLFGKEGQAPSKLADEMGMTRGAVTRLADRLIAKKLIVRRASPDDGRAQILSLTPAGAALVPELAALADENDVEFFSRIPDSERDELEAILRHLVQSHGLKSWPK